MINMNTDWKKECKAETLKTETELMQHADDLKLRVVPGFIILPLISFLSLIDLTLPLGILTFRLEPLA